MALAGGARGGADAAVDDVGDGVGFVAEFPDSDFLVALFAEENGFVATCASGRSVRSTMTMPMQTVPRMGTRWPRTSASPRLESSRR